MGTWKREDRQRIDDGAVMVMCNVTVKQKNGLSLNLPEMVTVYLGLAKGTLVVLKCSY